MSKLTLVVALSLCVVAPLGAQRKLGDDVQLGPETFEEFERQDLCNALHRLARHRRTDRSMAIAATVMSIMPVGTLPALFWRSQATLILALLTGAVGFGSPVLLGVLALSKTNGIDLVNVERQYPDLDAELEACGVDATRDFLRRGYPSTTPLAAVGTALGALWLVTVLVVVVTYRPSERPEARLDPAVTYVLPTSWPRVHESESERIPAQWEVPLSKPVSLAELL
jgi:hypothetical protein